MKGWTKVSPYALEKGSWTIAKAFVQGATLYSLFDKAGTCYGRFESAQEAAEFAEALEMGQT